ncbi:GNAT family N-acetyltransferase [Nocardia takedensis]|uniref:GNAT family N-acetyltransferase n=1 Tax=Nocardia takedensis TaxID=259390 RepID=UPI003F76685C
MDGLPNIESGAVGESGRWLGPVCALYDRVFSAPPYTWPAGESARHRSMLERMVLSPSFGITLAWSPTGELAGFVYGIGLGDSRSWWDGFREPVDREFTREWPGRTVAVIDLAVDEKSRRRGLGRELLAEFLGGRREQRATLAVQPQVEGARAFYERIGGWSLVGRQDVPSPPMTSPVFDIYVRALRL